MPLGDHGACSVEANAVPFDLVQSTRERTAMHKLDTCQKNPS